MHKLLLSIFCILCWAIANAQIGAANSTLQLYTTENGLPSNLIKGLQWDNSTGFLWVITEAGIVRLNGIEIKSYNQEKISPLAPEKSQFAVKNNAGDIFISDGSGNIYSIKKNLPVLAKPSSLSNSFINYHFIAVSDTFFSAKIQTTPAFSAPFDKIICLSDTSCLVLFENTLYKYSINLKSPVVIKEYQNRINTIFRIDNNCFFLDNKNNPFILNTSTYSSSPVKFIPSENNVLLLNNTSLFWQNGMPNPIYIDANNAWALEYEGGSIIAQKITSVLPTDANISSVEYSKKNKILFIGTESKGMIIITENLVQPKKRKNSNPKNKNAYFSQILLDNGNILTNEGDIIGNNNTPNGQLPINGKFSTRISIINDNLIWYTAKNTKLGFSCLQAFNKLTRQTTIYEKIRLTTQLVVSGNKLYTSNNNGIGLLQGDSILYLHQYPKDVAGINVYDFKEISSGVLAVAGCSGLLKFTIATKKLDTIYSLPNACFGSIWKYKDYIFWGSYGYGYYVYKNGIIKKMPIDKNEYLLYSHCFVSDSFGFCWISTNRGLFKVALEEIVANFENSNSPVYYHYFGKKDGIEMTELNGGCTPCALTLKDKTISFPSMDGLLWVNPITANPILPTGDIYIDEVLIENKNISTEILKNTTLDAGVQEIVIKLGFSAWSNKENLYIDYQFNDTTNWKKLKSEDNPSIQFNNLPSGKYKLRIRKLNGFGINNYSFKTVEFVISKKWFNQWWFYVGLFMALLGLVTLFGKLRNRQFTIQQKKLERQVAEKTKELQLKNEVLEKNDAIKTRLISIISHDIVTPLKFLTMAGKNLIEKKSVMPQQLQEDTLKEMTTTAQELQLLSTNILNWIKYQNENRRLAKEVFNLHDVVDHVMGILQSIARQKKLKLSNAIAENTELNQYLEPLCILLYNLVMNAINFTEKGSIIIQSNKADNKTIITVTDEGVGMTPEQIQNIMSDQFIVSSANIDNRKGNGLGYLIIKDLLKMMGASLQIKSEKTPTKDSSGRKKGTVVSIIIPS